MVVRREGPKVEQVSKKESAAERAHAFELKMKAFSSRFRSWFKPDLNPMDDVLDPDIYQDEDIKDAVNGLRGFIKEYPKESFERREDFPVWLKHAIEKEAIGELAAEDEDATFEFYRNSLDLSTFTDQNTPEENEAAALQWMARYIAPRMLVKDTGGGLDFVRRRVLVPEQVQKHGEEIATADVAFSAVTDMLKLHPRRAIDVLDVVSEMLAVGGHNDDKLYRREGSILDLARERFLEVDPDTAERLSNEFLGHNYRNEGMIERARASFEERLQVARARKLVRDGDVVAAHEAGKHLLFKNNYKATEDIRFFSVELGKKVRDEFHERKRADLAAYDLGQADELEYTEAKKYILSLPDDIPGFGEVCMNLSQPLHSEAEMRRAARFKELYPDHELTKERHDAVRKSVYQEIFGDIPELRWVNDNGVVKKTPEETLEYLKAISTRADVRQTLLKKVKLSDLSEIEGVRSIPEYEQIRQAVFQAQVDREDLTGSGVRGVDISPKDNRLFENFAEFGDLIQELEPGKRDVVVKKAIANDPYSVIFATERGLRLSEVEVTKVLEGVIMTSFPLDIFLMGDLDFFYTSEGVDRDHVLGKLIELDSKGFFSAFLAVKVKEEMEIDLSEGVSSMMMKAMVETNPIRLINASEHVKEYEPKFSEESVQLGYTSLFKRIYDGHHERVAKIQEFTGIDPDWKSVAKLLVGSDVTVLELESYVGVDGRVAAHMPWAEALKKLGVLQAHTANEKLDPWITDLEPLVSELRREGLISYESVEDGELIAKFVAEYGMIKAQNLAKIFIGLSKGDGIEDLSRDHRSMLVEAIGVGIELPDHKKLRRVLSRSIKSDSGIWEDDNGDLKKSLNKAQDLIAPRETEGVVKGEEKFARRTERKVGSLSDSEQELVKEMYALAHAAELSSAQLLHLLEGVRRASISGFLEDEVSEQLKTELGGEIFAAVVGGGYWAASGELKFVIDRWEKTLEDKPELAELPNGYKEETIEVEVRSRKKLSGDKVEQANREKVRILKNGALGKLKDRYKVALRDHDSGTNVDQETDSLFWRFKKSLKDKSVALEQKKGSLYGKALEAIEKRLQEIQEMQVHYDGLQLRDFYRKDVRVMGPRPTDSKGRGERVKAEQRMTRELPIKWMEQLVAGGAKGPEFDSTLLRLSARHANDTIRETAARQEIEGDPDADPEGPPNGQFIDRGLFKYDGDPGELGDEEFVMEMGDFIEQYLTEHYLHPQQEDHHTGHLPFSDKLLAALRKAWGVGKGLEKNPVVSAKRKLDDVNNPKELSAKKISVAMVPGQGLPRIMSGDTGNACTTSRHTELADGEYPDVHAFTYALGRGAPQERFAGSVLFVEAELASSDTSVVLVRANNPRENLIQSVDNVSFTLQSLEKAIDTAERTGAEEVLVPLDKATQSSSNRSGVSDVYAKFFSSNPRRALKNTTSTSFNGYKNWDASGWHRCVVVWTKKDGKINWPDLEKEKSEEKKKEAK
jgi:hypothetical protein